jgi:hypothetical protein
MRKLIAVAVVLWSLPAHAIETDKSKHAQVGFALGMFVHSLATDQAQQHPGLAGVAAGCAAGLGKELYDATGRGKTEAMDFLFTCGGAAIGSLISNEAVVYPGANGAVYLGWTRSF